MSTYPLTLDTKLAAAMRAYTYAEFLTITTLSRHLLDVRGREVRIDPVSQQFLASYPDVLHWVALVGEDAPEVTVLLPLLARLTEAGLRFDLRIVCESEGFDELAAWLDECGAGDVLAEVELPLLLFFDEDWQLQEQWGPFPQAMEPLLDEWLERHPHYETLAEDESPEAQTAYAELLDQLVWEMRIWFNSGLDNACAREICELLGRLVADEESGAEEDSSAGEE